MSFAPDNVSDQKVLRDKIKEHREDYFVVYHPADACFPFAVVDLVFLQERPVAAVVHTAAEHELRHWLKRFPVPVMISGFDVKGDLLHLPAETGGPHLMGYIDPSTGSVTRRWGVLKDDELPSGQSTPEYLARTYKGVPFRVQQEVRQTAIRDARRTGRAIRLIVFLIVGVPVLVEMISVGVAWLGYVLSGISVVTGLYKLAKSVGWLKPSKRTQEEAEKKVKMEHYLYHCERNPEAFNRLKSENFEREEIAQTLSEAEALRKAASGSL